MFSSRTPAIMHPLPHAHGALFLFSLSPPLPHGFVHPHHHSRTRLVPAQLPPHRCCTCTSYHAHTHSLSLSKAPHSDVLYQSVQSGGAARAAARYSVSSISQYTIVLMCTCCSCARGIRPWGHKGTSELDQSLPTCLLTVPRKRE